MPLKTTAYSLILTDRILVDGANAFLFSANSLKHSEGCRGLLSNQQLARALTSSLKILTSGWRDKMSTCCLATLLTKTAGSSDWLVLTLPRLNSERTSLAVVFPTDRFINWSFVLDLVRNNAKGPVHNGESHSTEYISTKTGQVQGTGHSTR